MDFKNILSQLSQLSEATKETEKGRIHKAEPGGYGRKYDTDEEGDEKKKAKKDEPKRGRGRPKKDAGDDGEVKKYDTKSLGDVFGGGKKPKKEVGKVSKKHSLKEWVDEIEQKYVAEAVPPGMKPLAILDPKNQNAGAGVVTSKNPAIQKMLGGLDPKDVQIVMTTQQGSTQAPGATQQKPTATTGGATNQPAMAEEGEKWIQKAIKHPGALRKKLHAKPGEPIPAGKLEKATHSSDPKTAKQARLAQTLRGLKKEEAGEMDEMIDVDSLNQLASHAVNTLGHGGAGLAAAAGGSALGGAIAGAGKKAIDWYQKRKEQKSLGKLKEGDIPSDQVDMGAGLGAGRKQETFEAAKPDFLDLDKDGNKKESMKKAAADKKKKKVDESMDTRLKAAHLRGKSHALAKEGYNCRYDDMEEARMYHEGYKEGLDECYGQVPIRGEVVGEEDMPATVPGMADAAMDEGNAFTAALAKTPHGGKFSVGGKTFTDRTNYDAKVDETMFESWNNELSSLLEEYDTIQEGLTVSISKGQQGAPDSVSVTAQDQEADQLLQLVKSAGLGLFGDEGGQQSLDGQSSPMSLQPADGGEEGDIDVVGDHDGMMALIKKVTGGAGEPNTVAIGGDDHGQDYEDEEGSEEHDHDHEDTDESTCNECGYMESECQCDDKEVVDEVESEDQMTYEVAEDNPPDSGAAEEEEEIQDTAQANASAADSGGAPDLEEGEEEDESEKLDEWANEAGQNGTDAAFEADIAFMTKVIAGGLNKEKATGQTTIPVIAGQNDRMGYSAVNESISDWKKLAGLK